MKTTGHSMLSRIVNAGIGCTILNLAFVCGVAADGSGDPHWNKATCNVCHTGNPAKSGASDIRGEGAEALCEGCHSARGDASICRHSSNIPAGHLSMPRQFQAALKEERIVCTTCHDIDYQCRNPSKPYSFKNPGFLRARESQDTGQYCFKCHDASSFEKLNPHNETAGEPPGPTCPLCHIEDPRSSGGDEVKVGFSMAHDLNDMCVGCHLISPHPGGGLTGKRPEWDHLAVPSEEVGENLRQAEQESGTVLPLSPFDGAVVCSTCHDPHGFKPHEAGIAKTTAAHRLRADDICQVCHDK